MSRVQIISLAIVSALMLLLPACGSSGDSGGIGGGSDPLRVTSSSIPPAMSGEPFNYVIDLAGGCNGPYVMRVIDGRMPSGLDLVDATHSIEGYLLEDGNFEFTVQIEDSGCTPFQSTVQTFRMSVGVGEVVVVDVLQDGNPSLIPADSKPEYAGYPALPEVVYNAFTSLQFVVAGGVGPYRMQVYDAPDIDDGPLPLGVTVPTNSATIVGSPVQVGDGGAPFLTSYRITDAVGNVGFFTAYWLISTPPIIVATEVIGNGTCGDLYTDQFFVAEGVPPFTHELVAAGLPEDYTSDSTSNPNYDPEADVIYRTKEGLPPEVNPPEALDKIGEDGWQYPAPGNPGPYDQGVPPEGVYLIETSGTYTGIPRRSGDFSVNYHVQSLLVPNNFGQHAWASFTFSMESAGGLAQNPAYTEQGVFLSDPNSSIPELEKDVPYNPDGGLDGLSLLASGGVPNDGYSDAPHASQREANEEVPGSYNWTMDYDPNDEGSPVIAGTACTPDGRFIATDPAILAPQGAQDISFTVEDVELPVGNTQTEQVRVAVGPDILIITESTQSWTGGNTTSTYNLDYAAMHDQHMRLKVVLPYSAGAQKRALLDTDLCTGTSLPDSVGDASLVDLLGGGSKAETGIDLLRVSANPAGWWNDNLNLNPKGARGMRNADANKTYASRGAGYSYQYDYQSGTYKVFYQYGTATESTSVAIPKYEGSAVSHSPSKGIYTDGGKLYAWDSPDYFGVFIIRNDSKIYVPIAFEKGDTWNSFGDNWEEEYDEDTDEMPVWKIPQMSVTPDGRFAVMKLSTKDRGWFDGTYPPTARKFVNDYADDTGIILFSLTGEEPTAWDDTYKIIGTGSSDSSTGEIMYAGSMVTSNDHLYYVCGTDPGTDSVYSTYYYLTEGNSWRYNWIYRYELLGGEDEGALLDPDNTDSSWSNQPGLTNSLQMPFQRANDTIPGGRTYQSGTYMYTYKETGSYYGGGFRDNYQVHEGSLAPMPFRVSADGETVAIVASKAYYGTGYSTAQWNYHVWVDDGGDSISRVSTTARRFIGGASRGTALRMQCGYYLYGGYSYQLGMFGGPTTQLEIADDGSKIAAVFSTATGSYNYLSYSQWYSYREDLIAWEKGSSGWTETEVTGGSSPTFATGFLWRFGGLIFTKANDGFYFWGGASGTYPKSATTTYQYSSYYTGSIYAYEFGSTGKGVYQALDPDDGGLTESDLGDEFDGKSSVNPTVSSGGGYFLTNRTMGSIIPIGGFMSPNREFYYIMNVGGLDQGTGKQEGARVIGINVNSLDTSKTSGQGRTDGYAFAPDWPSRRGFSPTVYYYGSYGIQNPYYAPGNMYDTGRVMTDNGRVFFGAHYQVNGPSNSTYSGPSVPTYYYGGGLRSGEVAFFDANTGGDAMLISTFNDGTSTNRHIKHIEPTPDGTSVSFLYTAGTSVSAFAPVSHDQEQLGYLGNVFVGSDGTVDMDRIYQVDNLISSGTVSRLSTAIANDSQGSRVFFASGTGDENRKYLFQTKPNPDGKQSPQQMSFTSDPLRYNVLHAGR